MNKWKFILFAILLIYTFLVRNVYSQINLEWAKYHHSNTAGNDEALSFCFDNNNNIRVTGSSYLIFKVIEYDPSGNLVSEITQNFGTTVMRKIVFNGLNTFFVSGSLGLVKIDSLNSLTYLNLHSYYDFMKGSDNYFYGLKSISGTVVTEKYNLSGTVIWSKIKQYPTYTFTPYNFFQGTNNQINVFANYYYFSLIGLIYGSIYLKYDTLGNVIFDGSNPSGQIVKGVRNNYSNNNFIAAFKSYSQWASEIVLYKTNANNSYIDTAYYNGLGNSRDEPNDIVADNEGNIYLACKSWGVAVNYDFVILKFSSDLNLLWEYRFNGSQNSFDSAEKLKLDANGNVYATGIISNNSDALNIYTVKLSSEGVLLWSDIFSRYNSSTDSNYVRDMQLDNSGNIYLCGKSRNSSTGKFDFLTMKYDKLTSIKSNEAIMEDYFLLQNYPNPFNPFTLITFNVPFKTNVKINIFSMDGKKIIDLVNTSYSTGKHTVKWDATDFPSGIYFISLESNEYKNIKKAILLK